MDLNDTILQIAREVTEINTTIPHLATKDDLREALAAHTKSPAHKKILNPSTVAKLVSAGIAAMGSIGGAIYAFMKF